MSENNFNQNYGTSFGFNVIDANEVYVVVLIYCDLKTYSHSMKFPGFRLPTSYCADVSLCKMTQNF